MSSIYKRKARDGSERVMIGKVIWKEKPARKRAVRSEWGFSREILRLREIEKIIRYRHGPFIPDPEDTDDRETALSYVRAAAFCKSPERIENWSRKWAPWAMDAEIAIIVFQASKRRRMMNADGAAGLLSLTWEERNRIGGIHTIGACDVSKAERTKLAKERKRQKDRERQEQLRRVRGCKDRKSHAASTINHLKPWDAEGISRSTWYRRQRETEQSRVVLNTNGDTFVSNTNGDTFDANGSDLPKPLSVAEGKRSAGLGEHPPAEIQEAAPRGSIYVNSQQAA